MTTTNEDRDKPHRDPAVGGLRHTIAEVNSAHPVIMILGPTAGGKTSLAIELAMRLPEGGECICADSMQVYRGMDIGTAKPTAEEQAQVPHHLLDLADPADDSFSVDRWLDLANQAISGIRSRGKWPIVVGGTNLYVQAFLRGFMEGPEPDLQLRAQLNAIDIEELRARLEHIDPAAAARIHRNDRKRTVRAIEVFERSGKRISDWQTHWDQELKSSDACSTILIGLEYPVEVINKRINARVKTMIDAGFVEEVRSLHRSGKLGRNAREALGYKQIIEHLEGRCSLEEAIEQTKIRTRRYAKQQRTWLRRFRQTPGSIWITAAEKTTPQIAEDVLNASRKTLVASLPAPAASPTAN